MEQLAPHQQDAVQRLQTVLDSQHYDTDVLISVLQSVDWNVHSATELILDSPHPDHAPQASSRDMSVSDHAGVGNPGTGGRSAPRSWTSTVLALLSLPFNVVAGILRFILGVLRIPFPSLNFNPSGYWPLRQPLDSRSAIRRWITALEEETGACSIKSSAALSSGVDNRPSTSRRHTYPPTYPDNARVLPDFFDGTYDEVVDICQKEGRISCVVLVSEEHDDVPAFKRTTLIDPTFVRLMNDNNFLVWGGDVRDRIPWDAAQKLQATTYPFVAFLALQPSRSSSTASLSSTSPVLTVLSRHYGCSVPDSGPTSAQTLVNHLEQHLLPRVNPFLTRHRKQLEDRERTRLLRQQQDQAYQDSQRRDRERVEARMRAEREETERLIREEDVRRKEQKRLQTERERRERAKQLRSQWSRWMRRSAVPPETQSGSNIRLAIRLPGSGRVVRSFPSNSTVTALYAFADSQTIPATVQPQDDPDHPPEGPEGGVKRLEEYIRSQNLDPERWWGFKLALSYPRRDIRWNSDTSLVDAGLKNGEQLVMEVMGNIDNAHGSPDHNPDDEYESESD